MLPICLQFQVAWNGRRMSTDPWDYLEVGKAGIYQCLSLNQLDNDLVARLWPLKVVSRPVSASGGAPSTPHVLESLGPATRLEVLSLSIIKVHSWKLYSISSERQAFRQRLLESSRTCKSHSEHWNLYTLMISSRKLKPILPRYWYLGIFCRTHLPDVHIWGFSVKPIFPDVQIWRYSVRPIFRDVHIWGFSISSLHISSARTKSEIYCAQ